MKKEIEEYYEKYGIKVYAYLLSITHEPDISQELMQETFCQAIKSLDRFEGKCSVFTWLCQIAKYLWQNELKRRKYHPSTDKEPDPSALDISVIPPDKATESADSKMFVLKQIHDLPEKEKEVILLRATGAMTFAEIGELFGKTESWARVTFYRAKQKLKKE